MKRISIFITVVLVILVSCIGAAVVSAILTLVFIPERFGRSFLRVFEQIMNDLTNYLIKK